MNQINIDDVIHNFKVTYKEYFPNIIYEIVTQYEADIGDILGIAIFVYPPKSEQDQYLIDELPDNYMEINIYKIVG